VSLPSDNESGANGTGAPAAVLSVTLVAASSGFSVNQNSSALGGTPNVDPLLGAERLRWVWNAANPLAPTTHSATDAHAIAARLATAVRDTPRAAARRPPVSFDCRIESPQSLSVTAAQLGCAASS